MSKPNYPLLYIKVVVAAVIFCVVVGFIAPYLISAANDTLVIAGAGSFIILPVVLYPLIKSIIKQIKSIGGESE